MMRWPSSMCLLACLSVPGHLPAAQTQEGGEGLAAGRLAELSLEELGNIEITSVSRRAERLSDAAASVFVITAEDIRRAGARSLPAALRLAPNLQVAEVSASGYAISSRGFNGTAANKLLVLIDGRSVYTPLFSGVFWDVQDVMLEDVERIEVISGPAGTLWGANAVNGVINVITRPAGETQGGLAAVAAGNKGRDMAVRYGGQAGAKGHYRVYGKYFQRFETSTADGAPKTDAWHRKQAGFRADWKHAGNSLTLTGNAYEGTEGQPLPGSISISGLRPPLGDISISGANLTANGRRTLPGGGSITVQAYLDRTRRTVPPSFDETLDMVDLQVQHSLAPMGRHALVWGGEYRHGWDEVANSTFLAFVPPRPFFGFLPEKVQQTWASLFLQDEITLAPALHLTVGARLDRNDYTGTEFLPSVRLAWKMAPEHLVWAAASRTVRAPSRLDRDVFVPATPPFLLAGGPEVRSEIARVYEIGYRGQPSGRLSWSVTAFHADYDHLRTQELSPSRTFLVFANRMEGSTSGLETWGAFQVSEAWRLSAGFSALREQLRLKPGSTDVANLAAQQGRDPSRSWNLRSSFTWGGRFEADTTLRHVSGLSSPAVPAYTVLDLRLGWRPRPDVELSVVGQNLFSGGHGEFADVLTRTQVEPSVMFSAVVRF